MLKRITTIDIEPLDFDVALGSRLNLLAGNNGLGKTHLLDLAWWGLTGTWAHRPPIPRRRARTAPQIQCQIEGAGAISALTGTFDFREQAWKSEETRQESSAPGAGPSRPGVGHEREDARLVIAVRSEGGIDVWDSCRGPALRRRRAARRPAPAGAAPLIHGRCGTASPWRAARSFAMASCATGSRGSSRSPSSSRCSRGSWPCSRRTRTSFLRPGPARRLSISDTREIPTILLPYGAVPVTHASAGMQRILALAYALVWAWREHNEAARLLNAAPARRLTLLLDEVDAHLHPIWQRAILPAVLCVFEEIEASLDVQVLATTHAPLVLAAAEALCDEGRDRLIHFMLKGERIVVERVPWVKESASSSPSVETPGIDQGRTEGAGHDISSGAGARASDDRGSPAQAARDRIEAEPARVLPGYDDFWLRWLVQTGLVK